LNLASEIVSYDSEETKKRKLNVVEFLESQVLFGFNQNEKYMEECFDEEEEYFEEEEECFDDEEYS